MKSDKNCFHPSGLPRLAVKMILQIQATKQNKLGILIYGICTGHLNLIKDEMGKCAFVANIESLILASLDPW